MEFKYCPQCGEKLFNKDIGDEGQVPFCRVCNRPYFKFPYPCVMVIVINEQKEVAMLKQEYLSKTNWGFVAGFIQQGERAESTVMREVAEEIGLKIGEFNYLGSYPHHDCHDQEVLLLGFAALVEKQELKISNSKEVDAAKWVSLQEADKLLRPGGVAQKIFSRAREILGY